MRQRAALLFTVLLLLPFAGCTSFPGSSPAQLRWGTYHTHAANNGLLLYGEVGDEVRLLNPSGAVISSAVLHPPDQTPCKANYDLPLPRSDLAAFGLGQTSWPAGYRVQTFVAGRWTDLVPRRGGCNATE
jgi:hypothetical protein